MLMLLLPKHNRAEGHLLTHHALLFEQSTRVWITSCQLATWLTAPATAPDRDAVVPGA